MYPEPGVLIAALESVSGLKPIICGKPSSIIINHVLTHMRIKDPSRVLMVGDRLDTDVLFANKAKFTSCLVLSGVTSIEDAEKQIKTHFESSDIDIQKTPQYVSKDLWDVVSPVSDDVLKQLKNKVEINVDQ